MTWILAGLLSALFIGVHDLFVIHAVRDNAVLPVLFPSTLTGATGGGPSCCWCKWYNPDSGRRR
jgi:hypothetical protein